MENITKQRILESIGKVYEQAKACKLENSFFETINIELSVLSRYFNISESQAFFTSIIFTLNYRGDSVDLKDLTDYFECNPMRILEYSDDFEYLCSIGLFAKQKSRHRIKIAGANDQFTIHEKVAEAILQNLPMPEIIQKKIEDIVDLLEQLYNLGAQRDDDKISTYEMFNEAKEIFSANTHFPLIEKVNRFGFNIEDIHLYLYLIWKTISGNESADLGRALEGIYDNSSKRFRYMQQFLTGEHILIKNDLLEIEEARFFNDTQIKLTETSHLLLNECEIKLFLNKKKKDNIIIPLDIPHKELIFDPTEMRQLSILKSLLEDDNFKKTQSRLSDKGLPKGITVLLHGAPGTGKTEIAKQLAKETNREVMKVEISQSKSMWFGESEKIIKRIFTDYKSYAKGCERAPILLFNEADAIISKRKEIGSSNVAQTENAIQNIILEELENFEGILIATTNLANNLDTAFDRRFLFKVLFQKPSASIRAEIWKSKLPSLTIEECHLLAGKFDLSGGQIDNIIRKNEIQEIVHGTIADFERILSFCDEESMVTKRTQIGFINPN